MTTRSTLQVTGNTESARIHLRVRPEVEALIERAATLAGMTVSSFMLSHACETARRLDAQQDLSTLVDRDHDVFFSHWKTQASRSENRVDELKNMTVSKTRTVCREDRTGLRGAFFIAPGGSEGRNIVVALDRCYPSWLLGAHGVALLLAWCNGAVQGWVVQSLVALRSWKARQVALCQGLRWTVLASRANFFVCHAGLEEGVLSAGTASVFASAACSRPPSGLRLETAMTASASRNGPEVTASLRDGAMLTERLAHLGRHGAKLRDCASFGLPGHVRLSVQPPASEDALEHAWKQFT